MQICKWPSSLLPRTGGDEQFSIKPNYFHTLSFQMFKAWTTIFIVMAVFVKTIIEIERKSPRVGKGRDEERKQVEWRC